MRRTIKRVLEWGLFSLCFGLLVFFFVREVFLQELEHHKSYESAAIMTFLGISSSILGAYLGHRFMESRFMRRVKKAAMDASLKVPFDPPPRL